MLRILIASALFVAMAEFSPSSAQQLDPEMVKVYRAAMPIFFNNPALLVNNQGVQKELKMDEDQVKAARDKVAGIDFRFGFGKGKDLTDEQKEKSAKTLEKLKSLKDVRDDEIEEKIRETFKAELEAPMKEVEKILKPVQLTRLKQIARQQGGPGAYLKSDNATDLKLSAEQITKLKKINDELQKEVGELRRGAGGGKGGFGPLPPETREKITALTKDATEKVTQVLTAEQRSKWRELTGEPFTVLIGSGPQPKKGN